MKAPARAMWRLIRQRRSGRRLRSYQRRFRHQSSHSFDPTTDLASQSPRRPIGSPASQRPRRDPMAFDITPEAAAQWKADLREEVTPRVGGEELVAVAAFRRTGGASS